MYIYKNNNQNVLKYKRNSYTFGKKKNQTKYKWLRQTTYRHYTHIINQKDKILQNTR